jgi:hypothetical protein
MRERELEVREPGRPWVPRAVTIAAILGLVLVVPAAAQFVQYTPPGFFEPRREDTEEVLERHMTEARWRAGRLYLDPWVGMRDSGYRDPVAGTDEGDLTITLGLGVRGWMPVGSDFTLAAHLLPEYSWWREFSDRNRWNGRYGAGLFGNFGRTGMELTARLDEYASYFSREFEQQVNTSEEELAAKFEVNVWSELAVFFGGSLAAIDYDTEDFEPLPSPTAVDRDESRGTVGVNYRFPYGITAGLGAEYTQADFEPGTSDRSNSGTAPVLLFYFEGNQLFATANLAYRSLTADGDSQFVDYDGVTGRMQLSWRTLDRLELQLFASNLLAYSFTDSWAYYEYRPIGLGARYAFTDWVRTRLFGETGSDEYTPFAEDGRDRSDDFNTWGLDVEFKLNRVWLGLGYSETDYSSDIPIYDRKIRRLGFNVGLGTGEGISWR